MKVRGFLRKMALDEAALSGGTAKPLSQLIDRYLSNNGVETDENRHH
jgi:hypothetical protein